MSITSSISYWLWSTSTPYICLSRKVFCSLCFKPSILFVIYMFGLMIGLLNLIVRRPVGLIVLMNASSWTRLRPNRPCCLLWECICGKSSPSSLPWVISSNARLCSSSWILGVWSSCWLVDPSKSLSVTLASLVALLLLVSCLARWTISVYV